MQYPKMYMNLNRQPMNVDWALRLLAEGGNESNGLGRLYMEVGKYKPWSMPVIAALRRRGYRVDKIGDRCFLLHPKETKE